MKRFFLQIATFIISVLLLATQSCGKGDVGPEGKQGKEGPKGEKGSKGEDGSANVFYSDWIRPTESSWNIENKPYSKKMTIRFDKLKENAVENGVYLVYKKLGDGSIEHLPRIKYYTDSKDIILLETASFLGMDLTIHLRSFEKPISTDEYLYQPLSNPNITRAQYRLVVIPAEKLITPQRSVSANVQYDYESIRKRFGILD